MSALVVASRFGMLLGLALWLGLAAAFLLGLPALDRLLPKAQARELAAALVRRLDWALAGAAALVLIGLGARVLIDRAAPPTSIVAPIAAMTVVRLVSTVLLARDHPARGLAITAEVCLGLYTLYAVS